MTARVRSLLASQPRHGEWVLTARQSPGGDPGDRQLSERRLLRSLKRLLKRLKLPGHLHTFRHAFISRALSAGTPEAVVRSWVGHVDQEIMKLYTHIADKDSQEKMQRLEEALERSKASNDTKKEEK